MKSAKQNIRVFNSVLPLPDRKHGACLRHDVTVRDYVLPALYNEVVCRRRNVLVWTMHMCDVPYMINNIIYNITHFVLER